MKTGEENPNQEQQTPKPEAGGMSEEQMKLMKAMSDKIADLEIRLVEKEKTGAQTTSMDVAMIAGVINESRKLADGDKDVDYNAGIRVDQMPKDDYDPKGVRFACPFAGYFICDDIRKGHIVKMPFGKKGIFFEYLNTRIIKTGKYDQIAPISIYQSNSKAEIKWLREHSLYGAMFFESTRGATDADASKAARMAGVLQSLSGLELTDILGRAREYGVPLSEDPQSMKVNIAFEMVKREIAFEAQQSEKALQETYKSELLIGRK